MAAAALLVGNLALLVDAGSPRAAAGGCGKSWHPELSISRPSRRDQAAGSSTTAAAAPLVTLAIGFLDRVDPAGGDPASAAAAAPWISCRQRRGVGSKVGAAGSGDVGGGGGGDEGGDRDWEEDLRSRLKEMEEMKELENRAAELVAEDASGEEETEEEKKERVRRELEKVAREQAERRKTAKLMFELGQKAYGKGMYSRAIEFLEAALTIIPRPTLLGGEIQIWLAMAYEANNRHRDCIALYQQLEKQHPSVSIRRQAAELRFILQAPKLKISKDEMVSIPLIGSSYDRYAGTWSDKYKNKDRIIKATKADQISPSKDYWGDFLGWRQPTGLGKSRAFWLILTLWLGLIGTAILLQR